MTTISRLQYFPLQCAHTHVTYLISKLEVLHMLDMRQTKASKKQTKYHD